MSVIHPSTLLQLWNITGRNLNDEGPDWNSFFDPIGLILLAPPRNYGYWCTPINSLTFAVTGGDGVHYGLLDVNGEFTDFSPVVMTVPTCDTPNTIVGANLREFLSLGCRFGYFALEQLVYQREDTLRELTLGRFDPEQGEDESRLLNNLTKAFNLKPWAAPRHRLEELEAVFGPRLQMPKM